MQEYQHYNRSQMREIRRKIRRRKMIRVWVVRAVFLAVLSIILSLLCFLCQEVILLASQGQPSSEVTVSTTIVPKIIISEPIEQVEPTFEVAEVDEVEEARISAYEAGELYYYNLTHEEKIYIAKAVHEEARGECFEGQVAVAAVILNRYTSNDPFFQNDTIYDVISQHGQFADISNVTDEDLEKHPSCMEAVEVATKGWDPTRKVFEEGAKYFFEPEGLSEYQKKIRTGIEVMVIGNHHFHNDFNVD